MSLVPVLDGSMNWQAWRPMMMNYLLSQGQWKVITNKFPAPDYETTTTVTKADSEGTHTETVPDISKPTRNQSEIDSWFDTNDRALGNIMLRLHPTIATTVLNLLQKTIKENDDITTMFASVAWEYLDATYGKPGIAATYKELKATMGIVIPGNADPTLAIDTILIGFTRMAASKCAVPPHLQAMILVSKLPYQMSALVQSICQTDNIEDLKTDDIKCKAILAWEQRGPTQTQNNRPFHQQPPAAKKISTVQRSGPPPSFQQQQQQPQQEEQEQRNQNQRGGWRGGRGGRGGTFRGTRAGKNKQNQQQQAARPIEERAPSPAPSFIFGKIASPVVIPDLPRSVYPNFTNALSLAHRIGAKPTIETVKRLEIIERAKEEQKSLNRPNKRPRRDDEVSLYWSSDDDDVEMFLDNSAGPSSRCAKLASPLDATNLFPSGYNTHATIETTSIIPYVENIICCPNVISDFAAEDHMNRVDWILDSGASLHFTGDMNDFIEYTPLEKNITANTATSANTQIIGKGTVMMAVEGSEHMVRIAVRADLGGHLKYSRRWSGVRAGVLLGAQGAVHRGENRGGL